MKKIILSCCLMLPFLLMAQDHRGGNGGVFLICKNGALITKKYPIDVTKIVRNYDGSMMLEDQKISIPFVDFDKFETLETEKVKDLIPNALLKLKNINQPAFEFLVNLHFEMSKKIKVATSIDENMMGQVDGMGNYTLRENDYCETGDSISIQSGITYFEQPAPLNSWIRSSDPLLNTRNDFIQKFDVFNSASLASQEVTKLHETLNKFFRNFLYLEKDKLVLTDKGNFKSSFYYSSLLVNVLLADTDEDTLTRIVDTLFIKMPKVDVSAYYSKPTIKTNTMFTKFHFMNKDVYQKIINANTELEYKEMLNFKMLFNGESFPKNIEKNFFLIDRDKVQIFGTPFTYYAYSNKKEIVQYILKNNNLDFINFEHAKTTPWEKESDWGHYRTIYNLLNRNKDRKNYSEMLKLLNESGMLNTERKEFYLTVKKVNFSPADIRLYGISSFVY
jgi:hypothetical protein